jgi:hypothetical protein
MGHIFPKIAALVLPNTVRSLLLAVILLACLCTAVLGQWNVRLTGRVVDDNGRPVAGASAHLLDLSTDNKCSDTTPLTKIWAKTAADGTFTVENHDSCRDRVRYLLIAGPVSDRYTRLVYVPYDYPGNATVRTSARKINVSGEGVINLGDLKVNFHYGYLNLKVVNQNGGPLFQDPDDWREVFYIAVYDNNGKMIQGSGLSLNDVKNAVDAGSGTVRFAIPDGRWRIDLIRSIPDKLIDYRDIWSSVDYFVINHDRPPINRVLKASK